MTQTGAELFVECLEKAGIDTIFGIPGEENTDLMLALEGSKIEFVLCRHEQGAAFMASVHGRLTGKPAGCLATLGPGATNLITGVADANLDHIPLVAITGQGGLSRMGRESHQMIDLEALFRPVTKHSHTILHGDTIPGAVAEAVRVARFDKPGAVHLCLPEDIAAAPAEGTALPVFDPPRHVPEPDAIVAASQQISRARRPIILAGHGVIRADAAEALQNLAEATTLPVAATFMAQGVLPDDHTLTLFTVGQPFSDPVDKAFEAADLILSVGFDPIEYPIEKLTNGGDTKVVHLGQSPGPADAGWHLAADVTGDLRSSLEGLAAGLTGVTWDLPDEITEARDAMRAAHDREITRSDKGPIAPRDILRAVNRHIVREDIVISGVGAHKMWIARHLLPKRPGQSIIPNGLAGMGLALPGAIAAARLCEGRALAICGDGDLLMNVQEMETAARLGLKLTVMVWDDGGYGLIKWKQDQDAGRHTDLDFQNPDWAHLAKAFDWHHRHCTGLADLPDALLDASETDGPTLLTLQVDYSENANLGDGK